MMKRLFMVLSFLLGAFIVNASEKKDQVTVLQLNIWQNATQVEGAFDAIVNEVVAHQPDVITLCEVRNYDGIDFTKRLCDALKDNGVIYYSFKCADGGIVSKYPIEENSILEPTTIGRAIISINGQKLAVYSVHLDYTHYACYLPRGYDGITWEECTLPKSVDEILAQNDASERPQQITCMMEQAEKDLANGCKIIVGGDFNEPSWLDWQADTKDLYDHSGFVVPWTTTKLLDKHGYKDAYREKYPSAVTHPGFTWVADNVNKKIEELTWTPKSDERDRIDFIFYKGKGIKVLDAAVFGPKGSIVKGQRVKETSKDKFIEPLGVWPSDHKGVWVTLKIR